MSVESEARERKTKREKKAPPNSIIFTQGGARAEGSPAVECARREGTGSHYTVASCSRYRRGCTAATSCFRLLACTSASREHSHTVRRNLPSRAPAKPPSRLECIVAAQGLAYSSRKLSRLPNGRWIRERRRMRARRSAPLLAESRVIFPSKS
jgi:hypothetical protein